MKTTGKNVSTITKMTIIAVAAIAVTTTLASTARAAWEGDEKPEFANAYTLRSGEWQIGLLRPTTVGLTDRLQLSTVLLGDVLGVPNVMLKLNLVDTEHFALSLSAVGVYAAVLDVGGGGGNVTMTFPIGERFFLSGSVGYTWLSDLNRHDEHAILLASYQGISMHGEAELLLDPHNILIFSASSSYNVRAEVFSPTMMALSYAHAWETFRLSIGVAYQTGGFEFDVDEDEPLDLPVMPMIDFWWRW